MIAFAVFFHEFFWPWYHFPEISGTTKGITMIFLPDVVIHKEAHNQEQIDINYLFGKLHTKVQKISDSWKCKFKDRLSYRKITAKFGLQNIVQPIKCKLGHVTAQNTG